MALSAIAQQFRLGKEVLSGYDITQLTNQQVQEFKETLWSHGVIVTKQQHLTASQLNEFAIKTFGDTTIGNRPKANDPEIDPDLQSPGVAVLGNPKGYSQEIIDKFAWQWHHDKDYLPATEGLDMNALYVVMLYGIEIPTAGIEGQPHTTNFLDMVEAYNNLEPDEQQQLEKLSMYHFTPSFRPPSPGVELPRKLHPIVSTHKKTGRKGLYLGSDTSIVAGMENRPEEAKQFWQNLFDKVLERTPVYSHVWQPGDILFWDNSQVMHTGTPYDSQKNRRVALRVGAVDSSSI